MKIVPSLLLIAAVFGVTLLTGCDEGMQMMKPAIEKPVPPEMEPEPPMDPEGSVTLTKEEAREKARGIIIDTVYARQILINPLLDLPGGEYWKARSAIDDDLTRILLEKTGFTWAQVIQLVEVHLEENAEEAAIADARITNSGVYEVSWVDIIAKYLEITFMHPTETENEILERFREYARDGETTLSVENVITNYFSVESADPPDGIRRTDDGQLLLNDLETWYIGYNQLDPTQEVPDKFLPLISPRRPELEPGKYRIKPEVIRNEQGVFSKRGLYISDISVAYSPEERVNRIRVIIEFTSDTPELKLEWG